MEDERQIIDDAQLWALESGRATRSRAASAAGVALQEYHKDLPEIISSSSRVMAGLGINVGESRTTTRRVLDSVTREIAGSGKDSYTQIEREDIMRKSLRDVLVQEAAGYEITRRGGVDPARAFDRDPDRGQGAKAIETLRALKVDIDGLLGHMTEHDLAKTSHGAYNKVSLIAHQPLMKAIEASDEIMTAEQIAINQHINGSVDRAGVQPREKGNPLLASQPVRRFQAHAPNRQPSFGRRMAQVQAMSLGASM